MSTIAVLITCHNRRETTLKCLRHLAHQSNIFNCRVEVFLVVDGCTDGTEEAVRLEFPAVHIIPGDGNLFWAGGMTLAERAASRLDADYHLWLNDDVALRPSALDDLTALAAENGRSAIVAGATLSQDESLVSYSGLRLRGRRPTSLVLVPPNGAAQEVDTFHGNVVLIPRKVHATVGPIDARFGHAYADNDYGLRARKRGHRILLLPEAVGTCQPNSSDGSWRDKSLSRQERLRLLTSRKAKPLYPHWLYISKHSPALVAPIILASSYLKAGAEIVLGR